MTDGGRWNEPAAPGPGRFDTPVPVATPDPVPLPLPPGTLGTPRSGRAKAAIVTTLVIAAIVVLCGLGAAGSWVLSDNGMGMPIGGLDPGPRAGVLSMQWVGGNRYAVVEYASAGLDPTTSVIAWDARTGIATKVDGFRLVAAETSSTQVWLARAVGAREEPGSDGAPVFPDSPWSEVAWGPSNSDGPGEPWSWDVATPDIAPVSRTAIEWRPWPGPTGHVAYLEGTALYGLWPGDLTFPTRETTVFADLPSETVSFLPAGWSPSGRYFALVDDNRWFGLNARVAIIDVSDGSIAASYETSQSGDGATTEQLEGVVWDPIDDELWIARMNADGGEDVNATVFSLAPDGRRTPVAGALREAGDVVYETMIVGRDRTGVLVLVQATTGQSIWRVQGGRAVPMGAVAGDLYGFAPGSYAEGAGILVQVSDPQGSSGPVDLPLIDESASAAAVVDIDGKNLRYIWPQK